MHCAFNESFNLPSLSGLSISLCFILAFSSTSTLIFPLNTHLGNTSTIISFAPALNQTLLWTKQDPSHGNMGNLKCRRRSLAPRSSIDATKQSSGFSKETSMSLPTTSKERCPHNLMAETEIKSLCNEKIYVLCNKRSLSGWSPQYTFI